MSEGSWYFEENITGVSDEFFDDVKFLDLPPEDIGKNVEEEDWNTQFQRLDEPCFDIFALPQPGLCSNTLDDCSLPPNKTLPPQYNDIAKLRQHPEASEDHSGKSILFHGNELIDVKDVHTLHIYSPVSVFESSSSCSVENPTFDPAIPIKRARSKRRRISNHSPLFSTPFIFSIPAFENSENLAASGSQLQSHSGGQTNASKKRQSKELSQISGSVGMKRHGKQDPAVPRKCTHCEVTKTPQWREGPMGPKTLCNACGVRHRSGRLFPEYRPAASPTFMESLHSNCHKKVLEMRNKSNQQARSL